ncbi:MAG: hypothetical protein R3346_01915 [Candidatus Spechtbacterales bacterium]|nr:hypothetical protein [Candidatus Spechtbacterales bacterium]
MELLLILLVVLIAAAVGYWWMFMRKDDSGMKKSGNMPDQPVVDAGGEKTNTPTSMPTEENTSSTDNTGGDNQKTA